MTNLWTVADWLTTQNYWNTISAFYRVHYTRKLCWHMLGVFIGFRYICGFCFGIGETYFPIQWYPSQIYVWFSIVQLTLLCPWMLHVLVAYVGLSCSKNMYLSYGDGNSNRCSAWLFWWYLLQLHFGLILTFEYHYETIILMMMRLGKRSPTIMAREIF